MLLGGPVVQGSWWGNDRQHSQQDEPGCVLKFEFHPSVNGRGRVKGRGGTWSDLCSRTTPSLYVEYKWTVVCVWGGGMRQPGSDGGRAGEEAGFAQDDLPWPIPG